MLRASETATALRQPSLRLNGRPSTDHTTEVHVPSVVCIASALHDVAL